MLTGKHFIAGEWVAGAKTFSSMPVSGEPQAFASGTPEDIDRAVQAAEKAFATYGATSRAERAAFLRRIADEIEARGAEITEVGSNETALPAARLKGERGRTTGQLRLFADHIEKGDYLDRRHDEALPDRKPAPRPDLRMIQLPVGPVGVFGASNFPLAFSTAGGDTASALAAGCPVIVKGHPAHPGTGELVAQAVEAAIKACGMPDGTFSLVQGETREVGAALVQHPLIQAVGFTGSLGAGRALFDLASSRSNPIPFFGELGSINPVFLFDNALKARGEEIAKGWAGSLTMGVGQFCTNPGIAVGIDGPELDTYAETARDAMGDVGPQAMLTEGIANAFRSGSQKVKSAAGVTERHGSTCEARNAAPALYETTGDTWLANEDLAEEVFGPLGILVRARDADQMLEIATQLHGQLTCTLQMDAADTGAAARLMPVLQRKAGRILANGFPTGVEVADAMVHGGPYPATTNFGATSVGTLAIRRFLRPVCFQNIASDLLPEDLR